MSDIETAMVAQVVPQDVDTTAAPPPADKSTAIPTPPVGKNSNKRVRQGPSLTTVRKELAQPPTPPRLPTALTDERGSGKQQLTGMCM